MELLLLREGWERAQNPTVERSLLSLPQAIPYGEWLGRVRFARALRELSTLTRRTFE